MSRPRIVAGVMTGTSIDGIDVAIARVEGRGLAMRVTLLAHHGRALGELVTPLRDAAEQRPMSARQFAELALEFGRLHAELVAEACAAAGVAAPDLVAAHGQTVYHRPPVSWQLLNAAPIAARLGCRVVCDLRQADLAAGGEGAPITPLADWILFRHASKRRAIVNLGGFCNGTVLPAGDGPALDAIRGADVCACNLVLDAVARAALDAPFDVNGQAAATGTADGDAVASLRHILAARGGLTRSLGTGDEATAWVAALRERLSPENLAASAVAAVGSAIGEWLVGEAVDEAFLAGGGGHHRPLREVIARASGRPVDTTATLGVPIEAREALEMAVLAALAEDDVPITLPQITGRSHAVRRAGAWVG